MKVPCPTCGKSFDPGRSLAAHVQRAHSGPKSSRSFDRDADLPMTLAQVMTESASNTPDDLSSMERYCSFDCPDAHKER